MNRIYVKLKLRQKSKMKIIHVAQFLGIGGLEKIIFHLALGQKALGHDVSVYIYDELRTWVDYFRENDIHVITPPTKKPGYDLSLLLRMNKDLMQADVINTHDLNPLMYLGPLTKARKLLGLKTPTLVHTAHGLDHIENYPRALSYQKLVAPLADQIIAVSDKIGQFYREKIKIKAHKVHVVQNGISLFNNPISPELKTAKKSWLSQRHHLDSNKPLAIALSRIVPLKNQEFLIKCFNQRPEYQLLIVGPSGDDNYYQNLQSIAQKNIFFAGPQELINDYNLGADLYVSASTHEGIPVAVLEAMAVKTPCLISNIAGHLTLLKYGKSVEIFQEEKMDEFLQKIELMFENKTNLKEMTTIAQDVVKNYYSLESMVNHYLKVYDV